jgi:HD superfamily phosphohydrolase
MASEINSKELFFKELSDFRELIDVKEGEFEKKIKDNVAELFDTPPIQALKNRYQLGLINKVSTKWENVKHTRFEHTVGVVAKCIIVCDLINKNSKNGLNLNEKDVRELSAAAALHDCGHLPISHAVERAFLSSGNFKKGVSHEERILPILFSKNPYSKKLREILLKWPDFNEHSLLRIGCIISQDMGIEYTKNIKNFVWPKRAIQQLLVSEIDLDRLDYVLRDSTKTNYFSITLIHDKIINYTKNLSLIESNIVGQNNPSDNVELLISSKYLDSIFNLLVSRVLLYKYIYFSEKLRSFEAVLTYLIGIFIEERISLDPLKLIAMSDENFINNYLDEQIKYIEKKEYRTHLKTKYIDVLKKQKAERFKLLFSIHDYGIKNPRFKEDFLKNIKKREYIERIKKRIIDETKDKSEIERIERNEILFDIFHIKTGGGDLLVFDEELAKNRTLKDFMNGSNMHRLCSETRLDVYLKSDLSAIKKTSIKNYIKNFFYYEES